MRNIIKKIFYYLLFPLWYFISKTWLGGMFLLIFSTTITAIILLITMELLGVSDVVMRNVGGGVAIVSLLSTPLILLILEKIDFWMENIEKIIKNKRQNILIIQH